MSRHPHEPLDAEEVAAARAYRALPGGEPSTELDARVLELARVATRASKRRARPWFMGAGFGAAAAAVMAAGIGWQLGWLGRAPGSAETPSTQPIQTSTGARSAAMKEEAIERVEIDYIKTESQAADAASMPAEPPAAPPPPPAPEYRRQVAPAPADPATRDDATPALSAPMPQPFPAEAAAEADAVLGAAESGPSADERERANKPAMRSAPASARSAGLGKQTGLPPWSEDAALQPDEWLARIRDRVRQGDRQGAEHSLRHFVLTHPQRAVPRELQRLLVE